MTLLGKRSIASQIRSSVLHQMRDFDRNIALESYLAFHIYTNTEV